MYCVLCLMSRLSIQEIKALDTSMVQMLCYVEAVDTHVSAHNFLNIQSRFSIRKKFWNAENQGFPTIPPNPIYVEAVEACRSSRY